MTDAPDDATRSLAEPAAAAEGPAPGERLADEPASYLVEGVIGAGGMGVVLAAKGEGLDRPVAIKVVSGDRDDLKRRFEREARVAARLQHPSIVPVYGVGHYRDGRPFYAMKQVTGQPLAKIIDGATTLAQRLALLPNVIAIADAIAYAHSMRVIHRDLKPQNVLVGEFGETVVIDWGLAKDLSAEAGADGDDNAGPYRGDAGGTAHGKVMGTPAYMPLEQARGESLDERADVYALGAILYHVLAGAPPHARAGEDSVPWAVMLARVIDGAPAPITRDRPDVPPELAAIVIKAMARERSDRYPSAAELAADLRRFQTGQLVAVHRYTTWQLIRRWARRHRGAVTVATIGTVALAVVSTVAALRVVHERDAARREEARATGNEEELLEEEGRQNLVAGEPLRAAPYLAAAWRLVEQRTPGDESPSLRLLTGLALRAVEQRPIQLTGAHGWVDSVAFSPDGRRVLGTSDQCEVLVWDVSSSAGPIVLDQACVDAPVAAFSADGTLIATGAGARDPDSHETRTGDTLARVWNASTGHLLATLAGHVALVTHVAFAAHDTRVVTDSDDRTVRVWDVATGRQLASIAEDAHAAFIVSRDGAHLAVPAPDGSVALYDTSTLRKLAVLPDQHIADGAFSSDGARIVTLDPRTRSPTVWDASSGKPLDVFPSTGGDTARVAFTPGGRIVVLDGMWPDLLRTSRSMPVPLIGRGDSSITSVLVSPDDILAATIDAGTVLFWNSVTGDQVGHLPHLEDALAISISADGSRMVVGENGRATVVDVRNVLGVTSIGDDGGDVVRVSPDGRLRLVIAIPGVVTIWDTRTGARLASLAAPGHQEGWLGAAFGPTSDRVLTWGLVGDDGATVWDAGTGRSLVTIHPGAFSNDWAWSPDGKRVWSATDHGVRVFDAASGAPVATLGSGDAVLAISFSWRGDRIIGVSAGGAQVWDAARLTPLSTWRRSMHKGTTPSCWLDDDRILMESNDGAPEVVDAGSGRLLFSLEDAQRAHCACSSDRALIACARDLASEGPVAVFDAARGRLLTTHAAGGRLTFTPDGRGLVVAGKTVSIYELPRETRSAGDVDAVTARGPWRLVDGRLIPNP